MSFETEMTLECQGSKNIEVDEGERLNSSW